MQPKAAVPCTVYFILALVTVFSTAALVISLSKYHYWIPHHVDPSAITSARSIESEGWLDVAEMYRIHKIPIVTAERRDTLHIGSSVFSQVYFETGSAFVWQFVDKSAAALNVFRETTAQLLSTDYGTINLRTISMNGMYAVVEESLMHQVVEIDGTAALERLRRLEPSEFFWPDSMHSVRGFISSNLHHVLPNALLNVTMPDSLTQSVEAVSVLDMLADLTAAVKELDRRLC